MFDDSLLMPKHVVVFISYWDLSVFISKNESLLFNNSLIGKFLLFNEYSSITINNIMAVCYTLWCIGFAPILFL